ncbi:IclR family transcriptional regulator [Megasphaera vaginalis (ex Bordigoni et al. 2020)]|uniref:IclR family transcriptional regulator n=1 Tax=Megasphaera vaginalis (ex Bordigoni et al. 2020) TaxID=2045301 RepID=UPI000C796D0C|nr:IclR family transcriptional regulator [Megasphaera vaginalis (ex Bordigoni et al. 2020)]
MIESIDRALAILQLFLKEERPLSVTQISKMMGLHKSTVSRTMETMEARGFISRDKDTGLYWPGLQIYSLGMLFRENGSIQKVAYPYAKALASKFGEGVHMTTFSVNESAYPQHVILEKIKSSASVDVAPPIGSVRPSHCAASGKCLLAFDEAYRKRYEGCDLKRFTEYTVIDWDTLNEELALIRKNGYAVEREEVEIGMACIAAPIFSHQRVVAAISLSAPLSRLTEELLPEIIKSVQKTAKEISQAL